MTNNRMALTVGKLDDNEHVFMQLDMNGTPLGHIHLDAAEAVKVAHDIGQYRAQLSEQVPFDIEPNARLTGVPDPAWRVGVAANGQRSIVLRHPGFGWLAFELPEATAEAISAALIQPRPA